MEPLDKSLTNTEEIQKNISLAKKGLLQLQMYTDLSPKARNWEVNLDKQPMPSGK